MDDIRRQDLKVFAREFFSPGRLFFLALALTTGWSLPAVTMRFEDKTVGQIVLTGSIVLAAAGLAYYESRRKRFINKRYEALWQGCQDRLKRFHEVLRRSRRTEVADLREMPATIRRIADSLYVALRRADLIANEVMRTERSLFAAPPVWNAGATDPQSRELYRIADKNIAEYRQQFAGVMAGVERAEAQSAVFMTTLDTLRMKMLGYQLAGRSPEVPSQDFLEAISEAKLQLKAIDHALEELELGPYPKQITVLPDDSLEEMRRNLARQAPPPVPPGTEAQAESGPERP